MIKNLYSLVGRVSIPTLLSVMIFAHSCSKRGSGADNSDSGSPTSVETRSRVAPNQQPAFSGQTRVSAITTQTTIKTSIIASGLSYPWGIDFLPDGRMMVSERTGSIRIVTSNGAVGPALTGVPPVVTAGEGGLLDVKISPEFSTSRLVFWTYVEPNASAGLNCVARGRLSANETGLEDVVVIYRNEVQANTTNHFGSRMLFDAGGLLYVTFGERSADDIRVQAQQLGSALGKIIRINTDGSPAAGNPFLETANARPEVFSYGHRNPQGLAISPVTGDLWESEHGPQAGDEVNVIKAGGNYGWPVIAYGLEYSGQPVSGTGLTQKSGMEQPAYYWDPAIAPSGMTFYTGSLVPEWRNNLFVASLKGDHIVRLSIDSSNNHITGEERLLAGENQRFRHVVQGPDGALYAITDEAAGRIYRIGI